MSSESETYFSSNRCLSVRRNLARRNYGPDALLRCTYGCAYLERTTCDRITKAHRDGWILVTAPHLPHPELVLMPIRSVSQRMSTNGLTALTLAGSTPDCWAVRTTASIFFSVDRR